VSAARRVFRRLTILAVCICALGASASAHYHFLHFANRTGPFVPIPEKVDLRALPEHTYYFYVSAKGPDKMADGDSFAAILSELRLAGQVWTGIETSELRVAFGGLFSPDTPQSTPHTEIVFGELPPGLLAIGGPTAGPDVVTPEGGNAFMPIVHSIVTLPNDLSSQPSSSTGFFLTAVHELGHALGLQHTATSSVMSTSVTRASTKASPLGSDDIASISLLYPTASFASRSGSISGQVSMSGAGVHLASVVALTTTGQAVSALTNPDGTYQIDGLAEGPYYVYVHALPPSVQSDLGPSEIVLPVDPDGKPFPAGEPFSTQFYPGTQNPRQAGVVAVKAGQKTADINFPVQAHAAPGLYGVSTYSFPGPIAVKPAYLKLNQPSRPVFVASGTGLMDSDGLAPGLNVAVLGASLAVAPDGVFPYPYSADFVQVNFQFSPFSGLGPRHLVFSTPNDTYVLPSALTLVANRPPAIASLTDGTDANGNHVLTITGSDLSAGTRILFDGVPGNILSFDVGDPLDKIVVSPPPAPANYNANVVALNPDGQTSLFLAPPASYSYAWAPADSPSISLSSSSQTAGTEAMITITASGMNFVDGQTWVGFGSSDVVIKDVWLVSPTVLRANVFVVPGAQVSDTLVSVVSGFQTATLPAGFHVRSNSGAPAPTISSDIVNADPAQTMVFPGSAAILPVHGLPADASPVSVLLNGVMVPVAGLDQDRLTFQVPASFGTGRAILELRAPGVTIAPVFVVIQPVPPLIQSIAVGSTPLDAGRAAHPGEVLTIAVLNLGEPGEVVAPGRLRVVIGGVQSPLSTGAGTLRDPNVHLIIVPLPQSTAPSDTVPVTVSIDGRASVPFNIAVTE
jgi:uncharacterized protein (TIGR03437 family)